MIKKEGFFKNMTNWVYKKRLTDHYAAISILASLYKRKINGGSEHIDLALFDCAVSALVNVASNYLVSGKIPKRYGNGHPNIVPYQSFRCKDGYFNLAVGNDSQFSKLVELLDDDRLRVERFKKNADRVKNREELIEILQSIFIKKESSYWVDLFRKNNIPAGYINTLDKVFEDSQTIARGMVETLSHKFGELKLVSSPIKLKEKKMKKHTPPPLLGEHTEYVLKNVLGYSDETIEQLKKGSII